MREEVLLPRDLHVVEHADEPDVTACPRGADGLHHRLLRADGLHDRVRAEPAGELLDPCRALLAALAHDLGRAELPGEPLADRKSTRLNSSHANISYDVFCLKTKDS